MPRARGEEEHEDVAGVGALGTLALQVLLIGGLLSMQSLDPILLNPDEELNEDGITMAVLCGEEGSTPEGRGAGS